MRYIPQPAVDIIRKFEGYSAVPYRDSNGLWTYGIGHLIKPGENLDKITKEEAEELLRADLQTAAEAVDRLFLRSFTDNQYSALLSFTYNLGGGTLQRSTLRMVCARGDDDDVPHEIMKYVYAGGRRVTGLVKRRAAEAHLYMLD